MKSRHLFFAMLALAGLAFGCKQEEDLGIAKISVNPKELSFGKEAASQTITLNATRDWEVVNKSTWVSVSPESGKGSTGDQQVTVTVLPNPNAPRTATLTFTIGLAKTKLTISQFGDGSEPGAKENPFNVTEALEYIKTLPADQNTENNIYVKGKISKIDEIDVSRFYNATYYISDDGTTTTQLEVYRGKYLGNTNFTSADLIKVGDEVIVCGKVVNYKGNTPEFVANDNYIYSLNGVVKEPEGGSGGEEGEPKGTGTIDDPFNATAAIAKAKEVGTTASSQEYYIKGTVTGSVEINLEFGNATFDITDGGSTFKIFRIRSFNGDKFTSTDVIKTGDEVVVLAKVLNYMGNTPETDAGGKLISLNGAGGGGSSTEDTPSGEGTLASPYNAAAAKAYASSLAAGVESDKEVYISGKIASIKFPFDADHGTATFDISESGSTSGTLFTIYSTLYLGNRNWATGDTQIALGDNVIVYGKVVNYQGNTPETASKKSYLYSLNGKTDGGSVTPETTFKFKKVTAVTAGKQYVIVGVKEGKTYIASPIGASSNYGYLSGKEVTVAEDVIEAEAKYAVTIAETTGGYTIAQNDGRFFGSAAASESHKTVQIVTEDEKKVWTITPDAGGAFKMVNAHSGRWMQHGEGTYTSFGMYLESVGTLPFLYEYQGSDPIPGGETPGGETPGGETPGGDTGDWTAAMFESNIAWTNVTNAYDDGVATVNGVSGVKVYKLGTSSKVGSATVSIPAGTKKISFYGVSWKGKPATVDIQVGGSSLFKQALAANDGATSNSPYTMTITASDHYEYSLDAPLTEAVTATVTTDGTNTRVILFGMKAE
ncbi:MAG: hypothetical protein IIZ90_05215 [Bacteroidales bacterium]|nr:hypothetical protein [Bacteroidales bacterium]